MYRHARRTVLLLATTAAPILSAQQPALQARTDSLLREWHEAQALARLQDSLRLAARLAGRDTVRFGALRVIANPSPLPLERAAALAWPVIEGFFGPSAEAFRRHPFVLNAIDPDTSAGPPPSPGGHQVPWDWDAPRLAGLLDALADLSSEDPPLRDWLGGRLAPPDTAVAARLGRAYVRLVTAPSVVAHRCLAGALPACRLVLELDSLSDPATQWYGAQERRRMVVDGNLGRGTHQTAWLACGKGDDPSCLELLRGLPPRRIPRPLDYVTRFSLLEFARSIGGPGTLQRLFAAPGPMGKRLSVATGMPVDTLVARWRAAVITARPHPVSLPPWGAPLALGWVSIFAACGLRSSRWRVG